MNARVADLVMGGACRHSRWVDANGHRRGSLLVVDDEPTITEVLSRRLITQTPGGG